MNKATKVVAISIISYLGNGLAMAAIPTTPGSPATVDTGPHVNHEELVNFVNTLKELRPISLQAHKIEENPQISKTEKEHKLSSYEKKSISIVTKNHLSPTTYDRLMKKAQIDPAFRKRVEESLRGQ